MLLRRTEGFGHSRVLQVGPLPIDSHAHAASLRDMHLDLRQMKYNLLVHLANDPQRVLRKQELKEAVWGYKGSRFTRALDSHASRLRRKLAAQGERWVINTRSVGYQLLWGAGNRSSHRRWRPFGTCAALRRTSA